MKVLHTILGILLLFSLFSTLALAADDEFKPYLHKATVPEAPKPKLYGAYSTELFPGAATYAYQLDVPPGTNGLQPSLVLTYNSQNMKQRPGMVGAGWSLSTSFISRDTNSTPLDDADDGFTLVLNGAAHKLAYNASDGFYHTQTETYMRIRNLSGSNDNGMYWHLATADGTTFSFGNRTSSELVANNSASLTLKWHLDEMRDTYGNNVTYTYAENQYSRDHGATYLTDIRYSNDAARHMQFSYENSDRPDRREVYEHGTLISETRRLDTITITVNSIQVRAYQLHYVSLGPVNSLTSLSKISFLGSDGISELHNVQFSYYPAEKGYTNVTWNIPFFFDTQDGDDGARLADLNNDGFVDLIRAYEDEGIKTVWINNRTGGWSNASSDSWKFPVFFIDRVRDDNGVRFTDLDNDGFIDIVQSYLNNASIEIKGAWLNNGSGFVEAPPAWQPPVLFLYNAQGPGLDDYGVQFMDLDGNGLADIVQAMGKDNTKSAYLNKGSGWVNAAGNWSSPLFFVDKGFGDNGTRVLDVNGDGLPDFIEAKNSTGRNKSTWLNNGANWTESPGNMWVSPIVFKEPSNPDRGVRFADADGDGLIDIWEATPAQTSTIYFNNGTTWAESAQNWTSPTPFIRAGKNIGRRLADINGDGLTDIIISFTNSTGNEKTVWLKNSTPAYALKSVKTELGANITISYQNSTLYNHTNLSGQSQLGFNMLVVDSVIQNNELSGDFAVSGTTTYNYSGGLYDRKMREFRGFGIVTETMPDDTVVTHYFHQSDALRGRENRTEVRDSADNLFTVAENTYNFTQTAGVFNVFLTSSTVSTYDAGNPPRVTNATYTYDTHGNLIRQHTLGDISVSGDERTEFYEYVTNVSANIFTTQSRSLLLDAANKTLRETHYLYDGGYYGETPTKGSITAVENHFDDGMQRTEYAYGANGQLITETDPLGRTTRYDKYDSTKTFAEQLINPLGHVTRFNYNIANGNLLWSEHNGIRTEFTYDQFGRAHKEIQPYDAVFSPTKETNYTFDSTSPETILVKQRTTQNLSFDTYYYYDGLGNLVQIKTPATNGRQVIKNFFYDGLGRVAEEQNPYFDTFSTALSTPSATAPSTTYSYDALGRVTNVTHPDGAVETVTFNRGNISTFDANGHRKDYFTDALDRITKIMEYNFDDLLKDGTIYQYNTSYGYDAADQLISINDTYGNQYKFTYDKLGRRIRLNDPDIGEWNYTYDLVGNLVSQAGGGGNLVSGDGFYREYNALNQLVLVRNGSSDAAVLEQYSYDPEGMRVRVWRNDSAQTVVYTPFRELMRIINSTGTYDFSYIYDGSTLVARIEPDGSKHYYHPDHLGSTTLITDEDGNVVEETFYEPFGAVTSGGTSDVKLYTGQFADDINNQYYYGARYYNPHIGKFMQPDPVIQAVYDPQFLNHYAYVRNNPYLLIDPNGKDARVYLDKGAASGLGHTAVGIDDIDIQGYQVIYDNRGIGEERIGSKTVRRILSFLSIVEPKVELRYGPIRDKAGNVILPEYGEQGYDDYFIIEQSREADEAMITQGFLLLRNPGKYNALTSSSLHFSLNILNAGRLDYNTINPVPNHVYYDLKGKVHQVKRFFVNPRTGELVGLKPGESYDPDKDEIVKDDNK